MVVMNIWMEVVRNLEDAVHECSANNLGDAHRSWDTAAALYMGSLEGQSGSFEPGKGKLLHNLANEACEAMHTCGQESSAPTGKAFVNLEVLRLFRFGQRFFAGKQCDDLNASKEAIVSAMKIPLVQHLLMTAYRRSQPTLDNGLFRAEGSIYAAAVVPLLSGCNEADAETVHSHMHLNDGGRAHPDFDLVKVLLEKNYECLKIQCPHVGGFYNVAAQDYAFAQPCTHRTGGAGSATLSPTSVSPAPTPNNGSLGVPPGISLEKTEPEHMVVVVAGFAGLVGAAFLSFVIFQTIRRRRYGKEVNAIAEGNAVEIFDGVEVIEFV